VPTPGGHSGVYGVARPHRSAGLEAADEIIVLADGRVATGAPTPSCWTGPDRTGRCGATDANGSAWGDGHAAPVHGRAR
jgi:hypothetical protein